MPHVPHRSRGSQAASRLRSAAAQSPLVTAVDGAAPGPLVRRARLLLRRLGTQTLREGYFTTFWLEGGARPAHALEELAQALARHARPGPRCSGVEWWIGRSYTTHIPIGFHFDLDVRGSGRVRHPLVSSVFFFNRVRGGQLAITDQLADRRGDPVPAQAGQLAVVEPRPNRYALFRGDRYHGVLDARGRVPGRPLPGPRGRLRLTLVINYWETRPAGVPTWVASRAYPALRRSGRGAGSP